MKKLDFLREVVGNFHAKFGQKPPAGGTKYGMDDFCHTMGCGWHALWWHAPCCAYVLPFTRLARRVHLQGACHLWVLYMVCMSLAYTLYMVLARSVTGTARARQGPCQQGIAFFVPSPVTKYVIFAETK